MFFYIQIIVIFHGSRFFLIEKHSECVGFFWSVSQRFILLTVRKCAYARGKKKHQGFVFLYRVYCMDDNAIISQVGVSTLNL